MKKFYCTADFDKPWVSFLIFIFSVESEFKSLKIGLCTPENRNSFHATYSVFKKCYNMLYIIFLHGYICYWNEWSDPSLCMAAVLIADHTLVKDLSLFNPTCVQTHLLINCFYWLSWCSCSAVCIWYLW